MRTSFNAVLIFSLLAVSQVNADELTDAAQNLCKTVQACATAEFAQRDLAPEMREIMQPMLDNMCSNIQKRIGDVPVGEAMRGKAVACMNSMAKLSCEEMQRERRESTPQCEAFDKAAKALETPPTP